MKTKLNVKSNYIVVLIVLFVTFAYFYGIPFLDILEYKTNDLRFKSRGQKPISNEVVIAVIDEKSLAHEGKWIWPRQKFANLINKLSEAGAKVISFDIGFLEPEDKKILNLIGTIQKDLKNNTSLDNKYLNKYFLKIKQGIDNDRILANAIISSKAKVVLGYFFKVEKADLVSLRKADILTHQNNISNSIFKNVHFSSGVRLEKLKLIRAVVPQSNISLISEASKYAGFFNMIPDPDGVVRWIPGVIEFKDDFYASLSLMSISAYLDKPLSLKFYDYGIDQIRLGNLIIPTNEKGQIFINYRGKGKTFKHISITDILNNRFELNSFKDKIVLIGPTATGIYDMRVTPFAGVFPGVEIHANVIDSILSNDILQKPGWNSLLSIFAIIFFGLFLGILLPRVGAVVGSVLSFALFFGYILFCKYLFDNLGWVLDMVYPLLSILLVYITLNLYKYLVEAKQKGFIKDAFSTYLAPSVVKQLIDSPEKLQLGGEKREITAFFSDVQGFTSISEKLSPSELVELLNVFLTEMTDIILKHKGTVDKFEGDAIIAFFGAPNNLPNHSFAACTACMEMQKKLAELRLIWKQENKPELLMRIGLSSGPAVVGNMGSKSRMDYTMMGDTVNTAARLESINKLYGTYTMISESTYKAAIKNNKDNINVRELDYIKVVGKKEPVAIYELLDNRKAIEQQLKDTYKFYQDGLLNYRMQKWDDAIKLFNQALEITASDAASKTMLERCYDFKKNPAPDDWDGSYAMTKK